MKFIDQPILKKELLKMAKLSFGIMVKAVVDVKKRIMVIDASLHSDEEAFLLSKGSDQKDLWGINLYPQLSGDEFIEYDSMINLRSHEHNMSREVKDLKIRFAIRKVVEDLIK